MTRLWYRYQRAIPIAGTSHDYRPTRARFQYVTPTALRAAKRYDQVRAAALRWFPCCPGLLLIQCSVVQALSARACWTLLIAVQPPEECVKARAKAPSAGMVAHT